jgi:hypothetical protein
MREALDAAPCRIHVGSWPDEILGWPEFPYVEAAAKPDLVVASVSALGFGEAGASLKDIYARASRSGLALGPAEIGPALRLGYRDQRWASFFASRLTRLRAMAGSQSISPLVMVVVLDCCSLAAIFVAI